MTKQINGRGRESRGLYVLDNVVPRPVACSGFTTHFETHCRLGHPLSSLVKNVASTVCKFVVIV